MEKYHRDDKPGDDFVREIDHFKDRSFLTAR